MTLIQRLLRETTKHTRRLPPRLMKGLGCEETYRAPVPGLDVPEPGVAGLGALGPVPGRPLMPEPLVPEPLLPEPEVCASTKGAVTTSTARAATTVLLNLLNISFFSYNLEGCACLVFLFEPCSPALPSAWEPCLAQEQFLCHGHAQDSAPSAVPSCGLALSYFESRRRRSSCKRMASKLLSKRAYSVLAKVGKGY